MAPKSKSGRSRKPAVQIQEEDLSQYNNDVDDFSENRDKVLLSKIHTAQDEGDHHLDVEDGYEIRGSVPFPGDENRLKSSKTQRKPKSSASAAVLSQREEIPFGLKRKLALAAVSARHDESEEDDGEDGTGSRKLGKKHADAVEEDEMAMWSGKKHDYYDGDDYADGSDEEQAYEEEKEVQKLRQKQARELKDEDFLGSALTDSAASKSVKSKKNAKQADMEADSEEMEFESVDRVERIEKNLQKLSKDEKLKLLRKTSPEVETMIKEIHSRMESVHGEMDEVLRAAKSIKAAQAAVVPFLEMKRHVTLSYCLSLSFYLLMKADGVSVKDHPVNAQLLQSKALVDKLDKMSGVVDRKLVKMLKNSMETDDDGSAVDANDGEEQEEPAQISKKWSAKGTAISENQYDIMLRRKMGKQGGKHHLVEEDELDNGEDGADSGVGVDMASEQEEAEEEFHFTKKTISKGKPAISADARRGGPKSRRSDLEDLEDFGEEKTAGTPSQKLRNAMKAVDEGDKKSRIRKDLEEEAPARDREAIQRIVEYQTRKRTRGGNGDDESDVVGLQNEDDLFAEEGEDNDLYAQAAESSRAHKKAKQDATLTKVLSNRQVYLNPATVDVVDTDEGKRHASQQMIKNRGLTAYRKKEDRNPRVKLRRKFDDAVKKHKSQVRPMREKSNLYGGETGGIKKNLSRSISLSAK
eukprot:ANDGO_04500.mRNA.1 Something about silencing protein 10